LTALRASNLAAPGQLETCRLLQQEAVRTEAGADCPIILALAPMPRPKATCFVATGCRLALRIPASSRSGLVRAKGCSSRLTSAPVPAPSSGSTRPDSPARSVRRTTSALARSRRGDSSAKARRSRGSRH